MIDRESVLSPRRALLIMAFGLVMITSSASAAVLHGQVVDRTDGSPLLGATVTVKSDDLSLSTTGTATDDEGKYEIAALPLGQLTVIVSFVGYSSETRTVQMAAADDDLELDVGLIPRAIDLNTISVTASRRPEKLNDAPAAVSLVKSETIQERASLTPTEYLKGMAGVDVATTGLNQSNVVTRGFNNIFSGALLVLVDNRIARVPSLRFNAYNFVPTSAADIEQIEVVAGPGSALYGPNSASGVMHIVTKSPFGSEGTTVTFGGGERDLVMGSFRHAGSANGRVGYKFNGQYYQGNDWEHRERAEPPTIVKYRPTSDGPDYGDSVVVNNARDFKTEKMAGEARFDFLLNENSLLIVNGGFNQGSGIELTGLGAGQAIDWGYRYVQARWSYKDLFIQGYVNASDAGDTYLLESGQLIVDKSRLWVAQLQHSYRPSEKLFLTYGVDGLFTRPNTEGTINGRNEAVDDIDELGAYFQGEANLSDKFKFVGAARVDDHNHLEDMVFSPRAGFVFQPNSQHNFRATYNRAYSTPDNNNLYLDIMQNKDPFGVGALFEPAIGFRPDIDIRVYGVPETGYHWRMGDEGPDFRSSFAPLDTIRHLTTTDYIPFNDPLFTNVMWTAGRGAVMAGLEATLQGAEVPQPQVDAVMDAVDSAVSTTVAGVGNTLRTFNPDTRSFDLSGVDDIADIDRLKPAITQTFELGYKGVLIDRLRFSVDAYRTKKNDFIGPLTVETPNVFLDPTTLGGYLGTSIGTWYATQASATDSAALAALDAPTYGGNGNGTPVDELATMFASGAARIPFGTVSPEESLDPTAVMVTYRNFGDIVYYGVDLSFDYHVNHYFNVGGSYSYVSKNFFAKNDDQVHDIHLNAPRNKAGFFVQYNYPKRSLAATARVRYVDAFNMVSPFLGSRVKSFTLLDLNAGINVLDNTRFTATVQNVFDDRHIEFVGAPELGRLIIARLTQSF